MNPGDEADPGEIRRRALDLLARREHAPKELARKLRQRGYSTDDIGPVLDNLIADNLLSTARYAESMVTARIAKGVGPLRISAELVRMDIDDAVIKSALAQADVDWFALADRVRSKRFGVQLPEDRKERARQMGFLQRRGFDFDCIRAAVGES